MGVGGKSLHSCIGHKTYDKDVCELRFVIENVLKKKRFNFSSFVGMGVGEEAPKLK